MRMRVSYSNGTSQDLNDSDAISIRNYPVSEIRKPGYVQTREYPPEWSKFTELRAGVVRVGHYVGLGNEVLKVVDIQDITPE